LQVFFPKITLIIIALALNAPVAYLMLGITYLVIALVRGVSILIDKSAVSSNIISLVVEIVFGIILVIPA